MKKISKLFTLLFAGMLLLASCEYDKSEWDALHNNAPDPNATYYIQFKDASKSLQTGVNEAGGLVDIETTVTVALLGLPQDEAINVNLAVDPSSTIDASMYTLSSNSITIPAGSVSGSVTLTTNTELMPTGEVLELVLNVDAGENNATNGTTLNYKLERINFCLLELSDYVGTWTGTDSWDYPTEITTSIDADGDLVMNGISFGWFQDWWGEVIVTNTPVKVDINLITGAFSIDPAKQTSPYLTSTYLGDPQPAYTIGATGKITSTCDQVLEFTYVFYQGGSSFNGTAWGPEFKEVITKN